MYKLVVIIAAAMPAILLLRAIFGRRSQRHRAPALNAPSRAGAGQVAPNRGVSRPVERHAPYLGGMELLPTFAEHAAAPVHRVGQPAFRRSRRTGGAAACRPGEHSYADQSSIRRRMSLARAASRHAATKRTRVDSSAGRAAATTTGGAHELGSGKRQGSSRSCWRSKIFIGLTRPRSISYAASPNDSFLTICCLRYSGNRY
jgi:hypothetical protein